MKKLTVCRSAIATTEFFSEARHACNSGSRDASTDGAVRGGSTDGHQHGCEDVCSEGHERKRSLVCILGDYQTHASRGSPFKFTSRLARNGGRSRPAADYGNANSRNPPLSPACAGRFSSQFNFTSSRLKFRLCPSALGWLQIPCSRSPLLRTPSTTGMLFHWS